MIQEVPGYTQAEFDKLPLRVQVGLRIAAAGIAWDDPALVALRSWNNQAWRAGELARHRHYARAARMAQS